MIIAGGHEETMVDEIRGLSPTISINQKTVSANPRSTVGTITEIYDFYRLLFLHIGIQRCPVHGTPLQKNTILDVFETIKHKKIETRFLICAPILTKRKNITLDIIKREVLNSGFIRYMIGEKIYAIADEVDVSGEIDERICVVIDRLVVPEEWDDATVKRTKDSIELAYKTGEDLLIVFFVDEMKQEVFSRQAACPQCHFQCQDLILSNFSFNSHHGACERCHGL